MTLVEMTSPATNAVILNIRASHEIVALAVIQQAAATVRRLGERRQRLLARRIKLQRLPYVRQRVENVAGSVGFRFRRAFMYGRGGR
jgi:hypothetical protein